METLTYSYCTFRYRSEWTGEITAVQTSKSTLQSKKAVIIAAGCWTGALVHELIKDSQVALDLPIKPRKVISLSVMQTYVQTTKLSPFLLLAVHVVVKLVFVSLQLSKQI